MDAIQTDHNQRTFDTGEEIILLTPLKSFLITLLGYAAKVMWDWEKRPSWTRIVAGLLVCYIIYISIQEYGPEAYKHAFFFCGGLLTNNIVNMLFKWANVNEQELMDKTHKWWNSDKH